jgi:hypothetical protein
VERFFVERLTPWTDFSEEKAFVERSSPWREALYGEILEER